MGELEDFLKKQKEAQKAVPHIEPSSKDLQFGKEFRAIYLSLVRAGFTSAEAGTHMQWYMIMHYTSKHPEEKSPWERE